MYAEMKIYKSTRIFVFQVSAISLRQSSTFFPKRIEEKGEKMCVYSQKLNTKKVLMFLLEKLWPEKKNARYGGGGITF